MLACVDQPLGHTLWCAKAASTGAAFMKFGRALTMCMICIAFLIATAVRPKRSARCVTIMGYWCGRQAESLTTH